MKNFEELMAATSPASIGDRIRSARKTIGLNQAALAERVGVSQPAVANWESGVHDPRRLVIIKLADALGVTPEWLASGARSAAEEDTHPAAPYIRRAIRHTPVIGLAAAARLIEEPDFDPHSVAEDYIPVTTGAERVFAIINNDDAVNRAFPRNTLVVIDYADQKPADGVFCLVASDALPLLRRWREGGDRSHPRLEPYTDGPQPPTLIVEPETRVIGCARVSIRFH